jgi:hypothetical protein
VKKFYLTGAAIAAVLMSAAPAVAAPNLIVNGGFESGPATANGGFTTITGPSAVIPGWNVTGSIDYIKNYWVGNASSASSIDLVGSATGTVSQTLTGLIVGQVYKVVFYFSANNDGGGNYPRQGVAAFGGTAPHQITVAGSVPGAPNRLATDWRRGEFYRKADASTMTLSFTGLPAGGDPYRGIALDSVSVSATPEPEAFASILLGLGLAGFVARRRRARAALVAA